eukprot:4549352-Amphidinium_carterae.1
MAAGDKTENMPAFVLVELALLRFVNLAERHIEGVHKTVKKDMGYNQGGPTAVSAAIRLDPFFAAADKGTVDLDKFLACLHDARQSHKLADHLGVRSHPDLHRVRGKEKDLKQQRLNMLRRLVYR